MMLSSIFQADWSPQNGCCQHLHSPEWVLVASFLTRQLFKTSEGSEPAPFIRQPLLLVLDHVRFCVCPLKSRVCVFCSPLGFPNVSLSGPQSWKGPLQSMESSSPCRSLNLGSPVWDLGPSPWQNPSSYDYHTLFWSPTNRYGSQLYCVSTLPPIPVGFFFFFAALHGMWDLSFLTKDQTHAPCSGSTEF